MGLLLEGHKLHLHPQRVADWDRGGDIAPIYVEVGPTSLCNHRCLMCAYDYLNHKNAYIKRERLIALSRELGEIGVKSVCFAGDGEPFLNDGLVDAIKEADKSGLDVAVSTNGVLLSEPLLEEVLPALSWIRFSINGGDDKSYEAVHRGNRGDFGKVLKIVENAAEIKNRQNLDVTIGVQFILLPENAEIMPDFAALIKEKGADYFVVKPFYRHPGNSYAPENYSFGNYSKLLRKVELLSGGGFNAVVRWGSDKTNTFERRYSECYGLSFITVISADGNVYPCLPHQEEEYSYGNINESGFSDIWFGKRRKEALAKISRLDKNKCQPNCRQHWINNYLWDIKNPPLHGNFI